MKDLAPHIYRQRLLVEGFYNCVIDKNIIKEYFNMLLNSLELKSFGESLINSSKGKGKEINQGYEAFMPLVDSGIAFYSWEKDKFISIIIYTCKRFDKNKAIKFTKEFFKMDKLEFQSF